MAASGSVGSDGRRRRRTTTRCERMSGAVRRILRSLPRVPHLRRSLSSAWRRTPWAAASLPPSPPPTVSGSSPIRVFVGLGSNIGERREHLQRALSLLSQLPSTSVTATSFLYASSPVSVAAQPLFLNASAALRTSLSPQRLLAHVKGIEAAMGRDVHHGPRHGPRVIDIDLLLYDDHRCSLHTPQLTIPHPAMHERLFVLQPLADIAPAQLVHPSLGASIPSLLQRMQSASSTSTSTSTSASSPSSSSPDWVQRVLPLGASMFDQSARTLVMGILNCTPDSFSDGGSPHSASVTAAVDHALRMADAGADVIDVGGESTRPGAQPVACEEEQRRILPVLHALHAARPSLPLSVDTLHSSTAEAAVRAGAVLVNDVSGGLEDERMLATVARLGVSYVCSHTRGNPQTMASLARYGDVVQEVSAELNSRLQAALQAGIAPWSLIVDPGIGFAKAAQHNVSHRHSSTTATTRQPRQWKKGTSTAARPTAPLTAAAGDGCSLAFSVLCCPSSAVLSCGCSASSPLSVLPLRSPRW